MTLMTCAVCYDRRKRPPHKWISDRFIFFSPRRDQWKNYEDTYHPVFTDGWAPEYPHFPDETSDMSGSKRRPDVSEIQTSRGTLGISFKIMQLFSSKT